MIKQQMRITRPQEEEIDQGGVLSLLEKESFVPSVCTGCIFSRYYHVILVPVV
jgi:hypothetical protein